MYNVKEIVANKLPVQIKKENIFVPLISALLIVIIGTLNIDWYFKTFMFPLLMITISSTILVMDKKEVNKKAYYMLIPIALIIKEPDYGTALAYITAILFILFSAGIDKKYIIVAVVIIAISAPIVYNALPDHALRRINVFFNPTEADKRNEAYNLEQSKLAVGAWEVFGMGLFKGNQTQLGFLHPKTTDFIFSVIGEEMGFIATGTITILYIVLVTKSIYIAKTAKDNIGSYIAIGIAGIFFFHMTENIGMTIGLLPITGVPLPFVSYGGSSLVTNFICIGLLLNISSRRQKAIFVE